MSKESEAFFRSLGRPIVGEEVFDSITDTIFFVKDLAGRYMVVNMPLVRRCGFESKQELIGFTAAEIFPPPMGERFTAQDLDLVTTGVPVHGQLELHLFPNGNEGWCMTWKEPLTNAEGDIVGLSGISRDLTSMVSDRDDLNAVSQVLDHIREHLDQPLHMDELVEIAGFSAYQLDRRIRGLFGISTAQYITRSRIELARHKLARTSQAINFIALDCGYSDQSSFTRQFRQLVGLTPSAYRENFSS